MDKIAGIGANAKSFMNRINFNTDRDAFNFLMNQMRLPAGSKGSINKNATIAEGYLRSEVDLTQQNQITFPITATDGEARNVTERRLQVAQMFLTTQMALMLYFRGEDPSPAVRAQAPLRTYEALDVNAGSNDVSIVWNGFLTAKVDQVTYFDAIDTKRFYRAGQAQEGVEVSTGATQPSYLADEWDSPNWGMYRLTPFIFLGGQSDNKITLTLPFNVDLTDNNATVVLFQRGMLIQNAYANNT